MSSVSYRQEIVREVARQMGLEVDDHFGASLVTPLPQPFTTRFTGFYQKLDTLAELCRELDAAVVDSDSTGLAQPQLIVRFA